MVKQKLISLKIDEDLLKSLDALCGEYGCKRNRMINIACKIAVENLSNKSFMFNVLSALSKVEF